MDMKLLKQHLNNLTELRIKNGGDNEWNRREVANRLSRIIKGVKDKPAPRPGSDATSSPPPPPKKKKPGRDN